MEIPTTISTFTEEMELRNVSSRTNDTTNELHMLDFYKVKHKTIYLSIMLTKSCIRWLCVHAPSF